MNEDSEDQPLCVKLRVMIGGKGLIDEVLPYQDALETLDALRTEYAGKSKEVRVSLTFVCVSSPTDELRVEEITASHRIPVDVEVPAREELPRRKPTRAVRS